MGGIEEDCNTGLSLGLGIGSCAPPRHEDNKPMLCLDLSFTLSATEQAPKLGHSKANQYSCLKKMEDVAVEKDTNNKGIYEENNNVNINGGIRKKLRLTKEQSILLEDSFKLHTNLNPGQKQALAEKLKLKPRQVEVWFQNRRARTKLKQTETDCEFLKKCCERLSDENRRLKRELQELQNLRAVPSPLPLRIQIPKATTKLPFCLPHDYKKPMASNEERSASNTAFDVFFKDHDLQNKFNGASS